MSFLAKTSIYQQIRISRNTKAIIATVYIQALAGGLFAQGLVNFANTPSTLVSTQGPYFQAPISVMTGPVGSFYFGLLTSPVGAGDFTFTGLYATNTGVVGMFSGGNGVAVPGWAEGMFLDYRIAGWPASLGHDFQQLWLTSPPDGDFGLSGTGNAAAGSAAAPINLFGAGGGSIPNGFVLENHLVPEPAATTLTAFGACIILLYRARSRKALLTLSIKSS